MDFSPVQIREINNLLLAYSQGNYLRKGEISKKRNDLDSITLSLNMLGEELNSTTVSRDFFSSIYDSVTEMLFVISNNGIIENINKSAKNTLGDNFKLTGKKLDSLVRCPTANALLWKLKKNITRDSPSFFCEVYLLTANRREIPVSLSCSRIYDRKECGKGFLVIAKDMTEHIENEKRMLRAVIGTQDAERKRISEDLHDSLGIELSHIKYIVSSMLCNDVTLSEKNKASLLSSGSMLDNMAKHIREICFGLMPPILEKDGIQCAIRELSNKINNRKLLAVHFHCPVTLPKFDMAFEMTIYRIIQEFINNTLKHANAKNIHIRLDYNENILIFYIEDDGKGFVQKQKNNGHGINNIVSRIRAFDGTYSLKSSRTYGTRLRAEFNIKR